MDIHSIRKEYKIGQLDESQVDRNPLLQFKAWFEYAIASQINEATAMVLSTVDAHSKPHSRVVLLKEATPEGFTFFTNYESNKAIELKANKYASLLFFWSELERQVRIEGEVIKIPYEESKRYFSSRPFGSQLGAFTSPQSRVIPNRDFVQSKYDRLEKEYVGKEIPMPDFWGGFILHPISIEFWQGRPNRLHDRILYSKNKDAGWVIQRLAP